MGTMKKRSWHIALFSLPLLGITGCQTMPAGFLRQPPGPIYQQQANAVLHDPYPNINAAPEIVGGRPRGFQKPLPEPVNSRLWIDSFPGNPAP